MELLPHLKFEIDYKHSQKPALCSVQVSCVTSQSWSRGACLRSWSINTSGGERKLCSSARSSSPCWSCCQRKEPQLRSVWNTPGSPLKPSLFCSELNGPALCSDAGRTHHMWFGTWDSCETHSSRLWSTSWAQLSSYIYCPDRKSENLLSAEFTTSMLIMWHDHKVL